jgi:hypothetical protein
MISKELFEDCGASERIYRRVLDNINSGMADRYGTEEVSKRIADHATNGGDMSSLFGTLNKEADFLINNCGYIEETLAKVHGSLNQNIVDSINLYSDVPLKKIPIFSGKLTSYSSLAVQKVNSGLQEAYNGLASKLGVAVHDAPSYVANKAAGAVSAAGSDDASLILGLAIGSVIGFGAYVGRKMGK